jgi:predicted nucleic acid-binding protein
VNELLLDATVWIASADLGDPDHHAAFTLVSGAARGHSELAALDLTLYEVANVAVIKWKSDSMAGEIVQLVMAACADTLERVDEELVGEASALAAAQGLTVHDAAYVAASRRRGCQLVSADIADLVRPGFAITPAQAAGA